MLKQWRVWAGIVAAGSLAAVGPPRMRVSPYFGNIAGMRYTDVEDLGRHDYDSSLGENDDLLYTARAGYIDMGHLRESADRTRYIFEISQYHIQRQDADYSFEVIESASYHVHLDYPPYWNRVNDAQKEKITREVAIDIGRYVAHLSTVWHEIVSWYGYSSTGFISEKPSSFSWEDGYSDLFGTNIAAEVLKANEPYNEGMTEAIKRRIEELDPLPADTARRATETIHGRWYSGRYPFLSMKKRNFDVGFDDGEITPFRVPGIADDAPEVRCPVPGMDALKRNGFKMKLTMTPLEMERKKILHIIYQDGNGTDLEPAVHFPVIIDHILKLAIKEEGADVDKPVL